MLLKRYIFLETIKSFLLIMSVLLLLALANRFTILLTKSASGQFPITAIFQVVILIIPELFRELVLSTSFAAVLITQNTMHANSEVKAMQALGARKSVFVEPIIYFALSLSVIVSILNLGLIPKINELRNNIASHHQITALQQMFQPGEFHKIGDDNMIIYIDSYDSNDDLNKVFLYSNNITTRDKTNFILADKAKVISNTDSEIKLNLYNGIKYIVFDDEMVKINFSEYSKSFTIPSNNIFDTTDVTPSYDLFKSDKIADKVEFQKRIVPAIGVILLSLLAIPLAVTNPRGGRQKFVLYGAISFTVYLVLNFIWHKMLLQGLIPVELGFWWIQFLVISLIFYYLKKM